MTTNPERGRLEELRELALRDLYEVDRQAAAGELSAADAEDLRRGYEREVLRAINALDTLPVAGGGASEDGEGTQPTRGGRRNLLTGRRLTYAVAIGLALLAAFLVQRSLLERPTGGLVTGNEVMQSSQGGRDLSKVSDKELEAVVQANPDVVGMRLALAGRYVDKGRYDLAVVHYSKVLDSERRNPEALAHLGWIMMQLDRPAQAADLVDTALREAPEMVDALWFQANIRLYGLKDPQGAISSLDKLRDRTDLSGVVRRQVDQLRAAAVRASQGTP